MAHSRSPVDHSKTLVQGALILTAGMLISRMLGAFYKPIVTWLFAPYDQNHGLAGLGLIQVTYPIYLALLSVSAIGFNIAISRLVAQHLAQNQTGAAGRVFRVALGLMAAFGLTMATLLYLSADLLAQVANRPETATGFRAIAPAIFVVAIMAAFRGFFQGQQEMTPYALSQVLEQVVRIMTGILLVWWLAPLDVALGAAGYNFGAVTGGLAALAFLLWAYWRRRARLNNPSQCSAPPLPGLKESPTLLTTQEAQPGIGTIIKQILQLAIPISIIGAALPIVQTVDSMLVLGRLGSVGVEKDLAVGLLGALGGSYSLVHLPPVLTEALYISLVPAVTEALTLGDINLARYRAAAALRLTMIFAWPAAVGAWALSDGIYEVIFRTSAGGAVLRSLAFMTLTLMIVQTTSGILQGAGNIMVPVRNYLIAFAAKIGLTWWWTGLPILGIHGAALASVTAFGLAAALNFVEIRRRMGPLLDMTGMCVKPGISAVSMGLLIWVVQTRMVSLGIPRFGTLISIALGIVMYVVMMLCVGGLVLGDFRLIPYLGSRLAGWLERLGFVRE